MTARNKPVPIQNSTTEYKPLIDLALLGVLKFNRYFTGESIMNSFFLVDSSKKKNDLSYFQANTLSFKKPPDAPKDPNAAKLYIAEDMSKKTVMNISLFLRLLYVVYTIDPKKADFMADYTNNFRAIFRRNESLFRHFGDMFKLVTNDDDISNLKFILNVTYLNQASPVVIGKFSQAEHDHFKTVFKNINILADLLIQELIRNAKLYTKAPIAQNYFYTTFRYVADKTASEKISGFTILELEKGDVIFDWDNWRSTLQYQGDSISSVKQEPGDSFSSSKQEQPNDDPFPVKQEPVDDLGWQQPSSSTDDSPFSQPSRPSRGTTNTGLSGYSRNEEPRVLRSSKEKDDLIEKLKNQVRQLQVTSSEAITLKNENNTLEKKITALEDYISCLKRNSDCISGGFFVFTDIIPNKEAYYAAWESNFMYYISFLVYIAVIRYSDKSKPFESVIQSAKTLIDFARSNASPDPVNAINSFLTFFNRFYSILEELYSTNDIFKKDQEKEKFFTTIMSPPYSFYLSPRFVLKLNRALKDNDVLIVRQYCLVELVYTITRLNYWKELENQRPFEYLYTKYFQQNAIPTFVTIIAEISKIKQYQSFVRKFEIPKPENRIKIFQKQFNEPVCNEPFFLQQSSSPQPSSSSESLSDD